MRKAFVLSMTIVTLIAGSIELSAAATATHKKRHHNTHRGTCISLRDYGAYIVETNACNAVREFAIEWLNGNTIVDYQKYKAMPTAGNPRNLRRRGQSYRLTADNSVPNLVGGSLLGLISPDHVSDNIWGLSNFSNFNAFVVALNDNPDYPVRYWTPIPAHGQIRHIANQPIHAIYAEQEPD